MATVFHCGDLIFTNFIEGDEDFYSDQCGHLNISLAYRELKRAGAQPIKCHIPLKEIPEYRRLRDIDPAHVERLKKLWPEPKLRPALLGELQPGSLTLIDGIHRVIASSEMEPMVDPVSFEAYVVPHRCLPLIRVTLHRMKDDGSTQRIDPKEYLPQIWGKYTSPNHGQRSPI